jgi:hypothetical protein
MEAITHEGASGILVEVKWLSLRTLCGCCVVRVLSSFVYPLFKGVGLLGVFSNTRGVGAVFEGLRTGLGCFVGVEGADPERDGVPGVEVLSVGLGLAKFRDRSRNEYSFL